MTECSRATSPRHTPTAPHRQSSNSAGVHDPLPREALVERSHQVRQPGGEHSSSNFPKMAKKSRFWGDDQSQLPQPVSQSSLNHSRPLWCRFVANRTGFPTTPEWPGVVENASRNLRYLCVTFSPQIDQKSAKMAPNGQKSRFWGMTNVNFPSLYLEVV